MIARLEPKEIDGDLYKLWSMLFNAIIHAKPYQFLYIILIDGVIAVYYS